MRMYTTIQIDIDNVSVSISRPQVHTDPIIVKATYSKGTQITRIIEILWFYLLSVFGTMKRREKE